MPKRKRSRHCQNSAGHGQKRFKAGHAISGHDSTRQSQPVLSWYYPRLFTLRDYLLYQLPDTAQTCRERLQNFGNGLSDPEYSTSDEDTSQLMRLLDGALVGIPEDASISIRSCPREWCHLSQRVRASSQSAQKCSHSSQTELVNFAIWWLFNKSYPDETRPPHILCNGLQRVRADLEDGMPLSASGNFVGIASASHNEHLEAMRKRPWADILEFLGEYADEIVVDMIVTCGIFVPLKSDPSCYSQISGKPVLELPMLSKLPQPIGSLLCDEVTSRSIAPLPSPERLATDIKFVRHRMLYAKTAFTSQRKVSLGLRRLHALNRYPNPNNNEHSVHILKYIFPRQFRLHNVFTSSTDYTQTAQPFKDYTSRELEIASLESDCAKPSAPSSAESTSHARWRLPKRLRNLAFEFVQKLQKLHNTTPYRILLDHYCPSTWSSTEVSGRSHTDMATSYNQVSAFCQAVVTRVWPKRFLGEGLTGEHNWSVVFRNIDRFVRARRFESFTLADFIHNLKVDGIEWLAYANATPGQGMALSDYKKRRELLQELVYYIFDSFVIPLIRSNFHVTEAGGHRNKLFYFRHDVWRHITLPVIDRLKMEMYEEVGAERESDAFRRRVLGDSNVRLVPKGDSMRPIINLRRRVETVRNGQRILGRSINSTLTPAYDVLSLEKRRGPQHFGSAMFSVTAIHAKLKAFRARTALGEKQYPRYYFVKVDIKSCFDNLPQDLIVEAAEKILSSDLYSILKHTELQGSSQQTKPRQPLKRYLTEARLAAGAESLNELRNDESKTARPGTVFVETAATRTTHKEQVMSLISEHVRLNMIKLGKKLYRQKRGIAQGSILSSLLCNLLYAEFERKFLDFLDGDSSILMRLIDDFLLITTRRDQAVRFLQVMEQGNAEYGIMIKHQKTESNLIDQGRIENEGFPYCGMLINEKTLEISKDRSTGKGLKDVDDTLTVEYSKLPGQRFERKILSGIKIQAHAMLFDTSYNRKTTVLRNLYKLLADTAARAQRYRNNLPASRRPSSKQVQHLVDRTSSLLYAIMTSKRRRIRDKTYSCSVRQEVVALLTETAFAQAFKAEGVSFAKSTDEVATRKR